MNRENTHTKNESPMFQGTYATLLDTMSLISKFTVVSFFLSIIAIVISILTIVLISR